MKVVEWGECYVNRDDTGHRQYGVCLHLSDGSSLRFDDIATSPEEMNRLVSRLRGERIDPSQLLYLIEDHLTSEYSIY